jgi:hypothetical protein
MKVIQPLLVTPGLDPRVHLLRMTMDCRVKPAMTLNEPRWDAL